MPKKDNSVRIKYPPGCARPSETEIVRFLVKHGVTGDDVTALYPDIRTKCFFVKFIDNVKAEEFMARTESESEFEYTNKVKTKVVVCDANEELKYIRIFEVAPEVTDEEVVNKLNDYGDVKQIVWEKVKPHPGFELYNGVRGVHIYMRSEVPDQIEIAGEKKRVTYQGMTERCFRCNQVGHKRFQCPKSAQARLTRNGNGSGYAPDLSSDDFPILPGNSSDGRSHSLPPQTTDDGDDALKNLMTVEQLREAAEECAQQQQNEQQNSNVDNTTGVQIETAAIASTSHEQNVFVQPSGAVKSSTHGRSRKKKITANSKGDNDKNLDLVKALSNEQRAKLRDRSRLGKGANNGNNGDADRVRSRSSSSSSNKSKH